MSKGCYNHDNVDGWRQPINSGIRGNERPTLVSAALWTLFHKRFARVRTVAQVAVSSKDPGRAAKAGCASVSAVRTSRHVRTYSLRQLRADGVYTNVRSNR